MKPPCCVSPEFRNRSILVDDSAKRSSRDPPRALGQAASCRSHVRRVAADGIEGAARKHVGELGAPVDRERIGDL